MKSFFIKSVKISTVLAFMCSIGFPAHAVTTPQVYCASLAAVSCEVLNVETLIQTTLGNVELIKYCKNQQLKIANVSTTTFNTWAGTTTTTTPYIVITSFTCSQNCFYSNCCNAACAGIDSQVNCTTYCSTHPLGGTSQNGTSGSCDGNGDYQCVCQYTGPAAMTNATLCAQLA